MKRLHQLLALLLLCLLCSHSPPPDFSIIGAWEQIPIEGEIEPVTPNAVWIFAPDYNTMTRYDLDGKGFHSTWGGPYQQNSRKLTQKLDFATSDSSLVGQEITFRIKPKGPDAFILTGKMGENLIKESFQRIDDGQASLTGAYRITSRMGRDGDMKAMRFGPRKTIKILSGSRFQWTAINTETKQFFGCGGGTYSFEEGVYTEKIEFFSRDSSRVGMSLSFEGLIEGDDWHHSGKSSRGRPIKEVWTRGRAAE